MNNIYKIERIKKAGYKIIHLGRNIEAIKEDEDYRGSIAYVFRCIFHY